MSYNFSVAPARGPLPGVGEGGLRFPVMALPDGRLFESFHVDVGSGDPVVAPADSLKMPPLLAFAGIAPATVSCYPLAQHIAEKVHAYVRPHVTGANTRVRDLVDLVLIARHCSVNGAHLHAALQATFAARAQGHCRRTCLSLRPSGAARSKRCAWRWASAIWIPARRSRKPGVFSSPR